MSQDYYNLLPQQGQVDPMQPNTTFTRPVATNTTPTNTLLAATPSGYSSFNPGVTPVSRTTTPTMSATQSAGYSQYDSRKPAEIIEGDETPAELAARLAKEEQERNEAESKACDARGGTWNPTTKICTPKTEIPGDDRTGTIPGTNTEIKETPPTEGDFKAGPDGKPLVFKNGRWEVYAGGTTREIITEDPAVVAERERLLAAADANVPPDQYLKSLGTDTLAGQAYTDALARRLASIDEQQLAAGQSYGDMYEQAKMSQAARRGLSDVSGMTGGMADQAQSRRSAAEIASLGQIGMGREATMRQLEMAELNAPMEAFQEGAQMDEFDRARQMQTTQMQQAEILFEQAQSGWMQDPDTGEWTNIDKQTQDALSLQAINATQRAELLGEIQYWQALSLDTENVTLEQREQAKATLAQLQTNYAKLLANSQTVPIPRRTTTTDEDEDEDEDELETETGEETPEPRPVLKQIESLESQFKVAGLDDATIRRSPFKDSTVRNASDLSRLVIELGRKNAANNPGYDYKYEIDLLTRGIQDRTKLTSEEAEQLENYVQDNFRPFGGTFKVPSGIDGRNQLYLPMGESTEAFLQTLLDEGVISTTDYKERSAKLGDPNFNLLNDYDKIIVISTPTNRSELTEELKPATIRENWKEFLDSYNRQFNPNAKPKTFTGMSTPKYPQEGDIWNTPYGKATFTDGRWR
jgi:hypothetical protein